MKVSEKLSTYFDMVKRHIEKTQKVSDENEMNGGILCPSSIFKKERKKLPPQMKRKWKNIKSFFRGPKYLSIEDEMNGEES